MRINTKKRFAIKQKIVCFFPLLFIFTMFILHLALPDITFSKEEMRYLTPWPVFQIENILNGSYETKVEAYFSDHFPFRNFWVHIQEDSNQILLNK
jgi:hypothetical protein